MKARRLISASYASSGRQAAGLLAPPASWMSLRPSGTMASTERERKQSGRRPQWGNNSSQEHSLTNDTLMPPLRMGSPSLVASCCTPPSTQTDMSAGREMGG